MSAGRCCPAGRMVVIGRWESNIGGETTRAIYKRLTAQMLEMMARPILVLVENISRRFAFFMQAQWIIR